MSDEEQGAKNARSHIDSLRKQLTTANEQMVAAVTEAGDLKAELEKARDPLSTSEALHVHFEEEWVKARSVALEEAARLIDERSNCADLSEELRRRAPLLASLCVMERETVAKVAAALSAVCATDDHADPEVRAIVRAALKAVKPRPE